MWCRGSKRLCDGTIWLLGEVWGTSISYLLLMCLPPLQRLKVKNYNSQMHVGFQQPEGSETEGGPGQGGLLLFSIS